MDWSTRYLGSIKGAVHFKAISAPTFGEDDCPIEGYSAHLCPSSSLTMARASRGRIDTLLVRCSTAIKALKGTSRPAMDTAWTGPLQQAKYWPTSLASAHNTSTHILPVSLSPSGALDLGSIHSTPLRAIQSVPPLTLISRESTLISQCVKLTYVPSCHATESKA